MPLVPCRLVHCLLLMGVLLAMCLGLALGTAWPSGSAIAQKQTKAIPLPSIDVLAEQFRQAAGDIDYANNDPFIDREDLRKPWCSAMADTHLAPWYAGQFPGDKRDQGQELEKAIDTKDYFKTSTGALAALRQLSASLESNLPADERAITGHVTKAESLVQIEDGVFRNFDYDYDRALSQGATLAPPLGLGFAAQLSVHLVPLTMITEHWCWIDPADRG